MAERWNVNCNPSTGHTKKTTDSFDKRHLTRRVQDVGQRSFPGYDFNKSLPMNSSTSGLDRHFGNIKIVDLNCDCIIT